MHRSVNTSACCAHLADDPILDPAAMTTDRIDAKTLLERQQVASRSTHCHPSFSSDLPRAALTTVEVSRSTVRYRIQHSFTNRFAVFPPVIHCTLPPNREPSLRKTLSDNPSAGSLAEIVDQDAYSCTYC